MADMVVLEIVSYIKLNKKDGQPFETSLNRLLERLRLGRGVKDDLETFRQLITRVIPMLLMHISKLENRREDIERLTVDVLCYLMSVVATNEDENSVPVLLNLFVSSLLYMNQYTSVEWDPQQTIITRLCQYMLPMALTHSRVSGRSPLDLLPIPTVIYTLLDTCENEAYQVQVLDTLMWLKRDICTDVLAVVAMGTPTVRPRALKLFSYYWLDPLRDYSTTRRGRAEWSPPICDNCSGDLQHGEALATVICLDAKCAAAHQHYHKSSLPLYMYLCQACDKQIHTQRNQHQTVCYPTPLKAIKENCELQRMCAGPGDVNQAVVTCFHADCTGIQRGIPLRMCQSCHERNHNDLTDDSHIYQVGPPNPWETGIKRTDLNEVFASKALLQALSQLLSDYPRLVVEHQQSKASLSHTSEKSRKAFHVTYSRETLFLLCHFCQVGQIVPESRTLWLSRFVSYILEWLLLVYEFAAPHFEDHLFMKVLRGHSFWSDLKTLVLPWLNRVLKYHPHILKECLKPHCHSSIRVKDFKNDAERFHYVIRILQTLHWNEWELYNSEEEKERGDFQKLFTTLFCGWMTDTNVREGVNTLKPVMLEIFNMQSNSFDGVDIFEFINVKLEEREKLSNYTVLQWLQDLTLMGVFVPCLFEIYTKMLKIFDKAEPVSQVHLTPASIERQEDASSRHSSDQEEVLNPKSQLALCVLMLDVTLAQLQLQIPSEAVKQCVDMFTFDDVMSLLLQMLNVRSVWKGYHQGNHHDTSSPCVLCQQYDLWFHLAYDVIDKYPSPPHSPNESKSGMSPTSSNAPVSISTLVRIKQVFRTAVRDSSRDTTSGSVKDSARSGSPGSESGLHSKRPESASSSQKAKWSNKVPTISKTTAVGVPSTTLDPLLESAVIEPAPTPKNKPHPSPVKKALQRQVSFDSSSSSSKVFQKVVKLLDPKTLHSNAVFKIIDFLGNLVPYLDIANSKGPGEVFKQLFFKLWDCLQNETSVVSQKAVPLFYKCVQQISPTLAEEIDLKTENVLQMFWSRLDKVSFRSSNWEDRFHSVEKILLLAEFTENFETLPSNVALFLAHCFCEVVALLQDMKSEVSIRTRYCMQTAKLKAVKGLIYCCVEMFNKSEGSQSQILKTFSSLLSAYPDMGVISYNSVIKKLHLFQRLWGDYQEPHSGCDSNTLKRRQAKFGFDDTMDLSGGKEVFKQIQADVRVIQQRCNTIIEIIILLMEILANPGNSKKDSDIRQIAIYAEIIRKLEVIICRGPQFDIKVQELRESHLAEIFLLKMSQILDFNVEFSKQFYLLSFLLRLLLFLALPSNNDFELIKNQEYQSITSGLELLDERLCHLWLKLFFVICYKYGGVIQNDSESTSLTALVALLLEILLNTLSCKVHKCTQSDDPERVDTLVQPGPFPTQSSVVGLEEGVTFKPSRPPLVWQSTLGGSSAIHHDPTRLSSKKPKLTVQRSFSVSHSVEKPGEKNRVQPLSQQKREVLIHNMCPLCKQPKEIFSEETITLSIVAMGTCVHRFPHVVAVPFLKDIILALVKVITPGFYPWQNTERAETVPGTAMAVAKQFLNCILAQFGERNLFVLLFSWETPYQEELLKALLSSLVAGKTEDSGKGGNQIELMTQATPVEYFLKECLSSGNLQLILREAGLVNFARYISLIRDMDAKRELLKLIPKFDQFFRKLMKPNLKKFLVGENVWHSVIRIMTLLVLAFKETRNEQTKSGGDISVEVPILDLTQCIRELLEMGLTCTECKRVSLYALLKLSASWFEAFIREPKLREHDRFLRLLIVHHLPLALQKPQRYSKEGKMALIELALLADGGFYGFLEDYTGGKVHIRELRLRDLYQSSLDYIARLQPNIDGCVTLLLSSEDPLVKLAVGELMVLRLDLSAFSSPKQILTTLLTQAKNLERYLETQTSKGDQNTDNPRLQILTVLKWLMIASMKISAAQSVTEPDMIISTGLDIQKHTPASILNLLGGNRPASFVDQILSITVEFLGQLRTDIPQRKEDVKATFQFVQVWTVCLELVQNELAFDVVQYLMKFWKRMISEVILSAPGGCMRMSLLTCFETLKQANITTLPSALSILIPNDLEVEMKGNVDVGSGSLDDWLRNILLVEYS